MQQRGWQLGLILTTVVSTACLSSLAACKKGPTGVAAEGTGAAALAANPEVILETTQGKLVIRLNRQKAPLSTQNFLAYVDAGFYDGTVFHRLIPDFMVQGGGFGADLQPKKTHEPVKNEADNGLSNKRGTVALARTNVVDSATSQFFINVKDNPQLDHSGSNFGYAVIGEVVEGMSVVDLIRNLPTRCPSWTGQPCTEALPAGMRDVPMTPIVITKAYKKA